MNNLSEVHSIRSSVNGGLLSNFDKECLDDIEMQDLKGGTTARTNMGYIGLNDEEAKAYVAQEENKTNNVVGGEPLDFTSQLNEVLLVDSDEFCWMVTSILLQGVNIESDRAKSYKTALRAFTTRLRMIDARE